MKELFHFLLCLSPIPPASAAAEERSAGIVVYGVGEGKAGPLRWVWLGGVDSIGNRSCFARPVGPSAHCGRPGVVRHIRNAVPSKCRVVERAFRWLLNPRHPEALIHLPNRVLRKRLQARRLRQSPIA